jgi:hypothetical protein
MKRTQVAILAFLIALFGLQQNCSDVTLVQSSDLAVSYVSGNVTLCLDQALDEYTLETVIASNLNLLYRGEGVAIDSDGDGISDNEESRYGFNPFNSRTNGRLLDRICLDLTGGNNCDQVAQGCLTTPNMFGLTNCDLQALALDSFPHPDKGLDSDQDSIPDFFEIRLGLIPNQHDALEDPDHDLKTNIQEISAGSNHKVHDQPQSSKYATVVRSSRLPAGTCQGELWGISVQQLPWLKLPGVEDSLENLSPPPGSLSLSRAPNTNVGVVYVKLRAKTGAPAGTNSKVLFTSFEIGENIGVMSLDVSNFTEAGDVLP